MFDRQVVQSPKLQTQVLVKPIQLVMIGSGGVGKSAVTVRFCSDTFIDEYDPTIEDSFVKQLNLDGEHLKLNILDTAGQEEYGALREQWYRAGDGFLFVFSVIERETFDELSILYEKVRRAREQERIPCVVVANKCDLRKQRTVTSAEARAFAKKLNCPFVKTSAKTGVNIDVAFRQCAKSVRAIDKTTSRSTTSPVSMTSILEHESTNRRKGKTSNIVWRKSALNCVIM